LIHRIAITPGEPAGIGPDICVLISQQPPKDIELVFVADSEVLEERAEKLGIAVSTRPFEQDKDPAASTPGTLSILHVNKKSQVMAGQLNSKNSSYVLETLKLATQKVLSGHLDAIVTGPVHKGIINDAGFDFSGHTEYLAKLCQSNRSVMMLATDDLRVALATTHMPLSDVPGAINRDLIRETILILSNDLKAKFGIKNPRILVSGLNPHAGENGHLGKEEIDIIKPTIEQLHAQGIDLIGPLPADTLFTSELLESSDAVLTMFHDQGLPVLKFKGFGNAVNITLGLPIIRTSVDHGTALDKAGTGDLNLGSMSQAISMAKTMLEK
jgi:4-hydroxythreonine-4-phosphate dehydrogenase